MNPVLRRHRWMTAGFIRRFPCGEQVQRHMLNWTNAGDGVLCCLVCGHHDHGEWRCNGTIEIHDEERPCRTELVLKMLAWLADRWFVARELGAGDRNTDIYPAYGAMGGLVDVGGEIADSPGDDSNRWSLVVSAAHEPADTPVGESAQSPPHRSQAMEMIACLMTPVNSIHMAEVRGSISHTTYARTVRDPDQRGIN